MSFHSFGRKNDNINNTEKTSFDSYANSPQDILKILILEKRELVLDAIQLSIQKNKEVIYIMSYLFKLFESIRPMLEKDKGIEFTKRIRSIIISSSSFESMLKAFEEIDDYLYSKNLTKVDSNQVYDSTDPDLEDERNGL